MVISKNVRYGYFFISANHLLTKFYACGKRDGSLKKGTVGCPRTVPISIEKIEKVLQKQKNIYIINLYLIAKEKEKMAENKEIKVRLSTVICLLIIVILVVALGVVYYMGFIKNKERASQLEHQTEELLKKVNTLEQEINVLQKSNNTTEEQKQNNTTETQKQEDFQENQNSNNEVLLSKEEIQRILRPDEATFCIEDIKKSGDDYIIIATMLENEPRIVSKAEIEKLKNGGEIEFRGQKWTLQTNTLHSGNDVLSLVDEKYIGNIAGVATKLHDYSNQVIKFKVSKDILIGGFFANFKYDKNGQIRAYGEEGTLEQDKVITDYKSMSFEKLLEHSKGCHGTYDECTAYVKDGVVGAIRIDVK